VDDVGDPVLGERPLDRPEVGDVAAGESYARELVRRRDQP